MYTNFGNLQTSDQATSLLKRSSCILWGSIIIIFLSLLVTIAALILFLVKGVGFSDVLNDENQVIDDQLDIREETLNKINE